LIQGKVSLITLYGNQLISGPKEQTVSIETFYFTMVSMATTAAP